MKISLVLKLSVLAACVTLAACDGDDDDGYGDSYGGNEGDNGSNGGNNGGNNDVTPLSANIATAETLMGTAFTVSGQVSVLLSDGSIQNQTKTNFTLYTFDDDSIDSSSCTSDGCITNWPPLIANESDTPRAPLSIIDRGDGNMQWALRGMPLYFFNGDQSPTEVNGEGAANGAWQVAVDEPTETFEDTSVGVFLTATGKTLSSTGADASSLKNWDGWTLFTRAADVAGETSTCTGGCLEAWPALLAEEGDTATAPYSLIDRPAGENLGKQWAYHGKPLYFRAADGGPQVLAAAANADWPLARPVTVKLAGNNYVAAGLSHVATMNGSDFEINATPSDGMSLYTSTNDADGESNCTDACLSSWPALMAPAGAVPFGPFTLATRSDTSESQWALNGQPLYLHSGDNAPGDQNGDGLGNGNWQLAVAGDVAPQNVTIEQLQADIFGPKCGTCHGGATPQSGLGLDSVENSYAGLLEGSKVYVVAGDADASLLVHKVEGQDDQGATVSIMPPGGSLNADEIASIRAWIDGGALPPEGNEPPPAPENVSIEDLQADIFGPKCGTCHGGATPQSGLGFDSVENSYNGLLDLDDSRVVVGDADASLLVHKVEGQDDQGNDVSIMPPGGSLSDLEIASIRAWINEGAKPPATVANVTIENLQADIFDGCRGCHGAGNQSGGLSLEDVQTSYDALIDGLVVANDADASFLVHKVEGFDENGNVVNNRMPQGGKLSAIQIASIRDWIDNGANAPVGGGAVAASLSDVQAIINANCAGCHTSGGSSGQLNMDPQNTYNNLLDGRRVIAGDAEGSVLVRRIDGGGMPPAPRAPLSNDDIATVRSWIDAGAPNN